MKQLVAVIHIDRGAAPSNSIANSGELVGTGAPTSSFSLFFARLPHSISIHSKSPIALPRKGGIGKIGASLEQQKCQPQSTSPAQPAARPPQAYINNIPLSTEQLVNNQ
ncbi:hypothetical protein DdX_02818 [Ditylenchus destructor]|uniref:Uncharacterized protein n=1 Tax=Ditylenchus destructor TaxID=166010 RepID=A0AAD4RCJ0_9BILA|nr:hypothetical protein DdX_02818 [Ditylenchus destructor]